MAIRDEQADEVRDEVIEQPGDMENMRLVFLLLLPRVDSGESSIRCRSLVMSSSVGDVGGEVIGCWWRRCSFSFSFS